MLPQAIPRPPAQLSWGRQVAVTGGFQARFMGSLLSIFGWYWDHEPAPARRPRRNSEFEVVLLFGVWGFVFLIRGEMILFHNFISVFHFTLYALTNRVPTDTNPVIAEKIPGASVAALA